jgi:hypothetical protein
MNDTTIWRREADGLTHRAVVTGNETDGFEIRSDCGLVGNACWEAQLDEDAEVTCTRCRPGIRVNHPEPQAEPHRGQAERNTGNGAPKSEPTTNLFQGADVVHSYTRKQAIADGVLIDVTATAREVGFRYPVALTAAVWGGYVRVPDGVEGQDEAGRLWDILVMLRHAIRQSNTGGGDTLFFTLRVRNECQAPQPVQLKAVCGPNDDGSPCLTILARDED